MSCSRPQRSGAGEAQTRGPSVSSQALSHCAPYTVNYITGKLTQPIMLEISSTRAAIDVFSVVVIGFMGVGGYFFLFIVIGTVEQNF